MFDLDGNGKISLSELKQVFDISRLRNSEQDRRLWTDIMGAVDTDKDGVISRDEFHEAMGGVIERRSSA